MKNNLHFLFISLIISVFAQAQNPMPNPGFENWTDGNPDQWFTINIPGLFLTTTPASPGHSGSKAAKCEVLSMATGVVVPILQSHVDENMNGFPIDRAYSNLQLHYKFHPEGEDVFKVAVFMLSENGTAVGFKEVAIATAAENFTELNLPIEYNGMPGDPVRCLVSMVIAPGEFPDMETPGSYFIVDDVELNDGGSTPVEEEKPQLTDVRIFPNPCAATVNITLSVETGGHYSLGIFDLQGREVLLVLDEEMHGGVYDLQADLSNLPSGTYVCKVASSAASNSKLLTIKR
jgi:hypothetical protein